jgi:hypothetical protein
MIPVVDPVQIKVKKITVNVMEVTIIINIVVMEIIITILVVPILIAKVQPVPNLGGINQPHHLGDVNLLPRAVNAITIITTIIITVVP